MREDIDPVETREWLDALDSLADHAGKGRTAYLLARLAEQVEIGSLSGERGNPGPVREKVPHRDTLLPLLGELRNEGGHRLVDMQQLFLVHFFKFPPCQRIAKFT